MEALPNSPGEVRSVLIPITGHDLLLPNAAVAEVIAYRDPQQVSGTPDWLRGLIEWRRQMIPLLSFEQALALPEGAPGHRARIAICNTLSGNRRLPYLGLITKGIPRLIRVTSENVRPAANGVDHPLVLRSVEVAERVAMIPSLDGLESLMLEMLGPA